MSNKLSEKCLKFAEGEKVLCFQGLLVYEAKCLKTEYKNEPRYFVHYNGWNKHWDEWVPEARIMKHNEENLQKQKDLLKQYGKDKHKWNNQLKLQLVYSQSFQLNERQQFNPLKSLTLPGFPSASLANNNDGSKDKPKRSKSVKIQSKIEKDTEKTIDERRSSVDLAVVEPKRKKLRVDSLVEEKETPGILFDITINIPSELSIILADDWDLINHQKQLYNLPAAMTVEGILKKYLESRENSIVTHQTSIELKEMALGLTEYFNVMLGSQLLYKFERPQFGAILDQLPTHTASQIYGLPHFLRFFVQMRTILPNQSLLPKSALVILITSIRDCLKYLRTHGKAWFDTNDYVIAPAEYHRRAMT
uniref:Chromo domain-containing protein n=1 Tax=Ciona savignyi TaxID=51511 RepID=H2ZBT9_CIOSA